MSPTLTLLLASLAAAALFFAAGLLLGRKSDRGRLAGGTAQPPPPEPAREAPESLPALLRGVAAGMGAETACLVDLDGLVVATASFEPPAELAVSAALLARTRLVGAGLRGFELRGEDGSLHGVQLLEAEGRAYLALAPLPGSTGPGPRLDAVLPSLWHG